MGLLEKTVCWGSGEYLWARDYWNKAMKSFWTHEEISLVSDVNDWKLNTTENERYVISSILKTFTQSELYVADYWTQKVNKWFQKPEINQVGLAFGAFESIHVRSYSYLNESLGLEHEFSEFLLIPEFKSKIDRLVEFEGLGWESESGDSQDLVRDIALSLAVFSGFTEGVSLFSSFAVLASFKMRNLFKGMGNIVEYSIRDEDFHSDFGIALFNTLVNENPEVWDDNLKKQIYQAARDTVALEDHAIDLIFKHGDLPNITAHDLKIYIRYRANDRLQKMKLKKNWKNLDKGVLERMAWFETFATGIRQSDFFAGRETNYARVEFDSESLWKGYVK